MPVADATTKSPILWDTTTRRPRNSEVGPTDSEGVQAVAALIPDIRKETVEKSVRRMLEQLKSNADEVVEEGGGPLSEWARDFAATAMSEIVNQALLNNSYSIEDIGVTPFARPDGGAYLIVDFHRTNKRLSIHILANQTGARVSKTSLAGMATTEVITSEGKVKQFLGWLTKQD